MPQHITSVQMPSSMLHRKKTGLLHHLHRSTSISHSRTCAGGAP